MITIDDNGSDNARIRVVGVGGCGGNAVNNMIENNLTGVSFIAANTDIQALQKNLAETKLQIGKEITGGLGAGGNPEIGKKSAEESQEEIQKALQGADMIFVAAGMGGGTGTGAAPVIARIAKEVGALVVGIVTKPFPWEGTRITLARDGIDKLRNEVDALITVPNEKLLQILDRKASFKDAFLKADEILLNAARGISDIITKPGLVNVDFADVRSVMSGMGDALMGIGVGVGENRAVEAAEKALKSPLLDNVSIKGAKGVLVNVSANENLGIMEVNDIVSMIYEAAGPGVNLIHGVALDETVGDNLTVTVVATGFEKTSEKRVEKKAASVAVEKNLFEEEEKPLEEPASAFQENAERIVKIPTGNDLRNYDTPAYIRKIGSNPLAAQKSNDGNFPTDSANLPTIDKYKENNYEKISQPAFLRRMMD